MGCDDEMIPLQERIETVTDEGDVEDVYTTERYLLYVACTRARDHLLVTSTALNRNSWRIRSEYTGFARSLRRRRARRAGTAHDYKLHSA
jgi:superfamily I DNA/RNA helicase